MSAVFQNEDSISLKWEPEELKTGEMGVFWEIPLRISQNYDFGLDITPILSHRIDF